MRVLMLSKALVMAQYRGKAQSLADKPDIELTVVLPPGWRDERGPVQLEPEEAAPRYQMIAAPLRFNGLYHLHYYPTIGEIISRAQPDIVHLDEEPYNFATFHALRAVRRHAPRARSLFFTWQNLPRTYPPPFLWIERYVYSHCDYAIAGTHDAAQVLRRKGFRRPTCVIPQFGVDPFILTPGPARNQRETFTVGFAGRLVPEKGALLLLEAMKRLEGRWELVIVGSGPQRAELEARARGLPVRIISWQPSARMPDLYRTFDVLVAPSVSRPNWTEQFGRVLVEAMACGIPVIGSSCGEIPNVIGDAGVVFRESNVRELARLIGELRASPERRAEFGRHGRARVLERFTQQKIVDETAQVYRELYK